MHNDYRETHPAYATIGASRVTSSPPGHTLFQTDFRHQHFVTVTIHRADLSRGLSSDHVFGTEQIIEVALSEAQWATFVATPNVGFGVPCTLEYLQGEGYVPGILREENRRTQFNAEMAGHLRDTIASMEEALAQAKTKAQREPIEAAIRNMRSNFDFYVKQFDEHAEETVEHAKIEVEAYLTDAIRRAGLERLGASPPIALDSGEIGEGS